MLELRNLSRSVWRAPIHCHQRASLRSRSVVPSVLPSRAERNRLQPLQHGRFRTTKSTTKPLLPLPNLRPDASHTDLPSFLSYASHTGLDTSSKVYVGTHYEYLVLSLLTTAHSFALTRVAGTNDRGIDLLGYWTLPTLPSPIRVIVQCKVTSKLQPRVVRELEGSFAGAPVGWSDDATTLAVLVGTGEATKGIREAIRDSGVGIVWMSVAEEEGRLRQMLWNQKARTMGLEGLDVVLRYDRDGGEELRMMWQGRLIPKGKNGRGKHADEQSGSQDSATDLKAR